MQVLNTGLPQRGQFAGSIYADSLLILGRLRQPCHRLWHMRRLAASAAGHTAQRQPSAERAMFSPLAPARGRNAVPNLPPSIVPSEVPNGANALWEARTRPGGVRLS